MKNWWHYYKWYVVCGILLLLILIDLAGNKLGWFRKMPDVQIAYIGELPLPEDTLAAVQQAFASLADDYNGDGEVVIQVNQYATGSPEAADVDSLSYRQASMIKLMGDIEEQESYFFLMENPDEVQLEFQVLAMPDGSCPADTDYSTENKVFPWDSCFHQELSPDLYLGRRCFYTEKNSAYTEECDRLWNTLTGGCQ